MKLILSTVVLSVQMLTSDDLNWHTSFQHSTKAITFENISSIRVASQCIMKNFSLYDDFRHLVGLVQYMDGGSQSHQIQIRGPSSLQFGQLMKPMKERNCRSWPTLFDQCTKHNEIQASGKCGCQLNRQCTCKCSVKGPRTGNIAIPLAFRWPNVAAPFKGVRKPVRKAGV
jgi:hypothetical protein